LDGGCPKQRKKQRELLNVKKWIWFTQPSTNSTIAAKRSTKPTDRFLRGYRTRLLWDSSTASLKPGGRLSGVYNPVTDLTAKRLEILKEIVRRFAE
jgi:hypothetical protein